MRGEAGTGLQGQLQSERLHVGQDLSTEAQGEVRVAGEGEGDLEVEVEVDDAFEVAVAGEEGSAGEVEVPFYDLTQGPLDPEARGHVRIRGHLIAEPKLAEYAVAQGKSPDQNAPPFATVRLLLPTPEFAVPNEGRYIAARVLVSQGSERQDGADIVEGVLRPLPEELINPLFGGHEAPEGNKGGLLLDAGEQPQSSDLAIDLALTLLAAFLALMAWRNAFGAVSQEESATPKEPENARA